VVDKKKGILVRVFLDHVDIHDRAGKRKGPNYYGPALFTFNVNILLALPAGSDILVTRKNPVHWREGEPDSDRYFESAEELAGSLRFGNFDKMLILQVPNGILKFPTGVTHVVLDDPRRGNSSGKDAYSHAETRLQGAARTGHTRIEIERRECQSGCICVEKYAKWNGQAIDFQFT
jgi:hypothetical protein